MNYLAHFVLAGPNPAHRVGALLGDFVKGPLSGAFPDDVERGIRQHRQIDRWLDERAAFTALVATFEAPYRRYAPIMLDVAFDHCVARRFGDFAGTASLAEFSAGVYADLADAGPALPDPARLFSERIADIDLLGRYADFDTVDGALRRIGTRLKRANPLDSAGAVVANRLEDIDATLRVLWPDLTEFAASALAEPE